MATGNMHNNLAKIGRELLSYASRQTTNKQRNKQTERQTNILTHHNTLQPYHGKVITIPGQSLTGFIF